MERIPFNRPFLTGKEWAYMADAQNREMFSGDGYYAKQCQTWLNESLGAGDTCFLTPSGTSALEMSAILLNVQPGDEVIMPSFTFPSTANAFVLRGGVPVFVDIREDTLNINENLIEEAITPRTRGICVVHYGGVAVEMDAVMDIAGKHGLWVVEDAAHALMSNYKENPLGSMGTFSCFSFHETKNIVCGDGGAISINDTQYLRRAEIVREKGTDRSRFFRGEIDKYIWRDIGSSFVLGELKAAFLWAQMEKADFITDCRVRIWKNYHALLEQAEGNGVLQRLSVPEYCNTNGCLYSLILPDPETRERVIQELKSLNIFTVFHFMPLHLSPAGTKYGRFSGTLSVTEDRAGRLLRLPRWVGLSVEHQERVVSCLLRSIAGLS